MLLGIDTSGQATTSAVVEQEAVDETQNVVDDISTERLGGSDRFATAATIATDHGGNPERVYLATGEDYPDALAAGAIAGASDAPVLLTGSGVLPDSTHSALETLAPDEVVVVGGSAAIGEKIAAAAGEAAGGDVRRIAGAHRLDTAAQLADELGGVVNAVYVATGEGFADALAGGTVAGLEGAPLLLTAGETLPSETAEVIEELEPERIEVLGGTAAITDSVVAELEQLTAAAVTRHAGADRFATAAEVVDARVEEADRVFIATGEDYPDALSGGAAAARQGAPLLLTGRDELPAEAGAVLSRLAPASLTVLGGEAAVSERVLSQAREQVSAAHHQPDHCGGPKNQRPDHCDDGEIAGTVTDSDTGDPIDGATVSTDTGESTTTNSDGDYTLTALDPADYDVTADADGFQSATETGVTVENNTTTTVDFALTPDDGSTAGTSADRLLSGDVSTNGFTVPAGEVWAFDPDADTTVTTDANVIVKGKLEMKPSSADVVHTLKFIGIDETQFQGGGMEVLESDVGLWVIDDGQLDLQGTERMGWNRTGDDPTWRAGDEVRRAPIGPDEGTGAFPEFTPGDTVPSVTAPNDSTHAAEVFNLTRNVRIHGGGSNPPDEVLEADGRTHVICLACNQPQTIKHVEFRWVGPREPHDRDDTDGRHGRYGLHFHHAGDGTQNSTVEGTVVRDAGNHAYVPHGSHGITFHDTISYDTYEDAYWWDAGDATNDLLYEHTAAFLTQDYPDYRAYGLSSYELGAGQNMTVRDSVAVGSRGNSSSTGASGFHWPSHANQADHNVWDFTSNVAHNNRSAGIGVWQNDGHDHLVESSTSFHNKGGGVSHGAYVNSYVYRDLVLFGNDAASFDQHALGSSGGPIEMDGIDLQTLRISKHSLEGDNPVIYRNLRVRDLITIDESGGEAGVIEFHYDCDHEVLILGLDDFDIIEAKSDITIHDDCNEDVIVVN